MIRATSPPAAQPMVGLSFSGQMTHTAYTSPPQMIMPATAPNALSSSRILVTSLLCELLFYQRRQAGTRSWVRLPLAERYPISQWGVQARATSSTFTSLRRGLTA
jgi:hypothetical protein